MRRAALMLCLLAAAFPAPALADHPLAPDTHGADPASIDDGADLPRGSGARAANSASLPTSWCGDERAADETRNELANGDFRYHAVYAVPADAPSRLGPMSGQIQTDAMRASALIEQLYGRAIRYDMGTACGSQFIDISVVRLAETTAQLQSLAGSATGTLDAISRALDAHGFEVIKSGDSFARASQRNRNWIVWLDGPGPNGACGQAMLYDDDRRSQENFNNLGGKVAAVFRDGDSSFCGANSVRHEIAHNLGAVVSASPHSSGGHCTDAIEDTMCVPGSPERGNGAYHAVWFDYGNDDYWDPAGGQLPWWTVNLNRFLCPDAGCNKPAGYSPPPPPAESGSGSRENASTTTRRRARVRLSARRYAPGRWSLAVRVRGRGTGVVAVSCRTSRRAKSSTVWSRRTRIPRTLRKRVRCASRPKVSAWYDVKSAASNARAATSERWRTAKVRTTRSRSRSTWRLSVRVRTRGEATVRVSCPRSRSSSRVVWSRVARAPRSLRTTVRCSREPVVGVS